MVEWLNDEQQTIWKWLWSILSSIIESAWRDRGKLIRKVGVSDEIKIQNSSLPYEVALALSELFSIVQVFKLTTVSFVAHLTANGWHMATELYKCIHLLHTSVYFRYPYLQLALCNWPWCHMLWHNWV